MLLDGTVVKRGIFLYDATIVCDIRIVKTDVRYGTGDAEDPPEIADDQPFDAHDPLKTHTAAFPAETPEEKAALRAQIAKNQKLIEEIGQLMKQHNDLLGGENQGTGDIIQAEDMERRLKQMIQQMIGENQRLRGEPPVPKDAPRTPRKD